MVKNYNKILEAVNRGIKFALDDFEDQDDIQGQTNSKVKYQGGINEYLDLMKIVVDLGLPSGNLWCKYNLGCNYEKLNNDSENTIPDMWYGDYYAWGQTKPNSLEEYDKAFSANILTHDIDPSYQNMHFKDFKFFTPSVKDFQELLQNTIQKNVQNYKINYLNGIELTSKINGNKLFLPNNGLHYSDDDIPVKSMLVGSLSYCWTATANKSNASDAIVYAKSFGDQDKSFLCGIRPVLNLNR